MAEDAGGRYWEIDVLRGIAVITMILFHTAFDLRFFGIAPLEISTGFWRILAYATAGTFIFLVGVSLTISHARAEKRANEASIYLRYLRRGLVIFAYGLCITAVTWTLMRPGTVVFGILHFIGIAIIIAPLFFRFKDANLVFGTGAILAGFALAGTEGPLWLLWLGVHPAAFSSLDYVPLLPWFGLVLFGLYCGRQLYPAGVRSFTIRAEPVVLRPMTLIGRHSLLIYFLHQPVILFALFVLVPGQITIG
jgi:uncharacterized membrane protein